MSNPDVVAGYRSAREAQLQRFEAATNGLDRTSQGTPEWREYFGLGEFAGGGVETPLTFKSWLQANARPAEHLADDVAPAPVLHDGISAESAFWLSGADLAALAADGDAGAVGEIARRAAGRAAKRAARVSVAPRRLSVVAS